MTVLSVVAHPDDEVIGVGGTLARHTAEGADVHVCILSDGVTSRYDELTPEAEAEIDQRRSRAREACDHLGVESVSFHSFPDNRFDTVALLDLVKAVEATIDEVEPTLVYTHHYGDLNVDHELTCRAVMTATRPMADSLIEEVLAFETLSATEWATPEPSNAFQPQTFVDVSDHLMAKREALETYESELREPPHPRSLEVVKQNAAVWGSKAGVDAAEPFELLRRVRR